MPAIENLANSIPVTLTIAATVLESKPATERQNNDIGQKKPFTSENRQTVDTEETVACERYPRQDSASNEQVNENESFRRVLERRLSEKSEEKQTSQEGKSITEQEGICSEKKPDLIKNPANHNPELEENNNLLIELPQLKAPTKTTETDLSLYTWLAIPQKGLTAARLKQPSTEPGRNNLMNGSASAENQNKNGANIKTNPLKAGITFKQVSAEGQNIKLQTIKTNHNAKPAADFAGKDNAKTVDDGKKPIGKTGNEKLKSEPLSGKNDGPGRRQSGLKIVDGTTKENLQPIDTKINRAGKSGILIENNKAEYALAAEKLSKTEPKNHPVVSVNVNNKQVRAKAVQGTTEKNQSFADSKNTKSATQKDSQQIPAVSENARKSEIIADSETTGRANIETTDITAKMNNLSSLSTANRQSSVTHAHSIDAGPEAAGSQITANMRIGTAQQIIDGIRLNIDAPQQQIYLSLNPPELGKVALLFRNIDGEITGLIQVEKTGTKYEIEQALPQIIASIQQTGVQVGRVNVSVNEQNQQQTLKNNDMPNYDFDGTEKHTLSDRTSEQKNNNNRPNSTKADTPEPDKGRNSKTKYEFTDSNVNMYI